MTIEHAQSELIKAYSNYHNTMNKPYALNLLGHTYWDADGNPFQITQLQYCQEEIERCQKILEVAAQQQWDAMSGEAA